MTSPLQLPLLATHNLPDSAKGLVVVLLRHPYALGRDSADGDPPAPGIHRDGHVKPWP